MIPKVIHYCWFGGKPLPRAAKKCIASWRKYCPDYEIREWNEQNYDINRCAYMREAAAAGKWAFVSDYARVDILHEHGGVYLDTDVELLKPLDDFLQYPMFCGWEKGMAEENRQVWGSVPEEHMYHVANYGLGVGSEAGHPVLKTLLEMYADMHFVMPDGSLNQIPCPVYQTRAMQQFGLNATKAVFQQNEHFTVFPAEYFSPKSYYTGLIEKTPNTVSIHHFSMSWKNGRVKFEERIRSILSRYMPHEKAYHWVRKQSARYDYWVGRIKSLIWGRKDAE